MLQNAYFVAKIGADTAENEQHFAENLPQGCLEEDDPLCTRVWKRRDGAKKWGQASRGRE